MGVVPPYNEDELDAKPQAGEGQSALGISGGSRPERRGSLARMESASGALAERLYRDRHPMIAWSRSEASFVELR